MRNLLHIGALLIVFLSGCSKKEYYSNRLTLNDFLHSYDLWYVNVKTSNAEARIPFLQKAFTLTFDGRNLLANNNLVGLGRIGNGYGDIIAGFHTDDPFLTIHHSEGLYRFEVEQISENQIVLYDVSSDASYRLDGYSKSRFDYDRLFYDNIIYFLQEYRHWIKEETQGGNHNLFDDENTLRFYSLDGSYIFNSIGRNSYRGTYSINDTSNLKTKILTLNYIPTNEIEQFELRVLTDNKIELYHIASKTTYRFRGFENIIFRKPHSNYGG